MQQFDIIGTRPPEELAYIRSDDARRFLDSLPRKAPVPWATLYPAASPLALALLDSMLQFHPSKRVTVEAAMAHAYFDSVRKQYDAEPEPAVCSAAIDCAFEYDASLGVAGEERGRVSALPALLTPLVPGGLAPPQTSAASSSTKSTVSAPSGRS